MARLRTKRAEAGCGLMGHIIADGPSPALAREAVAVMAEAGVKVIEIQMPFSEPMADGPVFMKANHRALAQGVRYEHCLRLMEEASRKHADVDFVFMTYLNVPFVRGYEAFAREAARAGARGVIVPDLPIDASDAFAAACASADLSLVRLIAPNTQDERLERIAKAASELLYVVARTGVTGQTTTFGDTLAKQVEKIRRATSVPLAIGFGVSKPDDVRSLRGLADYAVVGTAAFRVLEGEGATGLRRFWDGLAQAARI